MTIKSGIFNSVNGDRKYNATDFASYFASFIGNGVFPNPSNSLQVVAATNLTTVVKAGKGWINGYFITNDSDYELQHSLADGTLKRIDRVVMRLNYLTRQIEIAIKRGTSASSPVAPTLQRDTDYVELALADVLINNGATVITQANITDTRLNNALCGIVHGTVDQVDTTTLFAQYESWYSQTIGQAGLAFENMQEQLEQEFMDWFASIQDILDGDVATNLASRVINLENNLTPIQSRLPVLKSFVSEEYNSDPNTTQLGLILTRHANGPLPLGYYYIDTAFDRAVSSNANAIQVAKGASSNEMHQRRRVNGTWTAWQRKLTQADYDVLFQLGNNVKRDTVNALLSVDNSLPITTTSAWSNIISSIPSISSLSELTPGDNLKIYENRNNVNSSSFTPLKIREVISLSNGGIRVTFRFAGFNLEQLFGNAAIYINGTRVGVLRTKSNNQSTTLYTEDFNVNKNDRVQIYAWLSGTPTAGRIQNVQISDFSVSVLQNPYFMEVL